MATPFLKNEETARSLFLKIVWAFVKGLQGVKLSDQALLLVSRKSHHSYLFGLAGNAVFSRYPQGHNAMLTNSLVMSLVL